MTCGTSLSPVAAGRVYKEAPGHCDRVVLKQVAGLNWSQHFCVSLQAGKWPGQYPKP